MLAMAYFYVDSAIFFPNGGCKIAIRTHNAYSWRDGQA